MIRVRLYRSADLPHILKIEKASFGADAWPRELFIDYARHCPELFLVAEIDAVIAGYSIASLTRKGNAEIDSIAVLPRWRGHGVARLLLARTLRKLRSAEVGSVGLMVRRDNPGAIRLYRSFGFVRTGTVSGYYEDGATAWRMRLAI